MATSDPFRRVRPGEAVRISAIAWNRMLDLVRPGTAAGGGGAEQAGLPQQLATLRAAQGFVPARSIVVGEAVVVAVAQDYDAGADAAAATVPLAVPMTFSATERRLFNGFRPTYSGMSPTGGRTDDAFAICLQPLASRFVVSGFAWTRVRALRRWHRFARRCVMQPGDTDAQIAASFGTLDSCGYGPAQIIGWAPAGFDPAASTATLTSTLSAVATGDPGGIFWALVRF